MGAGEKPRLDRAPSEDMGKLTKPSVSIGERASYPFPFQFQNRRMKQKKQQQRAQAEAGGAAGHVSSNSVSN